MSKITKSLRSSQKKPKPKTRPRVTFGLSSEMKENISADYNAFSQLPDDLKSCDQIMLEALGANKKVFELLSESMQHRVIKRKKQMIVFASLNLLSSDRGLALLKDNPRWLIHMYQNRLNDFKRLLIKKPELLSTMYEVKSQKNSNISLLHRMIRDDFGSLLWASTDDAARQYMVRFFEMNHDFFDYMLKHTVQNIIYLISHSSHLKNRLLEKHYEKLNHLNDPEFIWNLALETCRDDGFRLHAFKQFHADKRFILSVLAPDHHDRVLPDKVMAAQYIAPKLFEDDAFMMEVLNVSPQSILYIDHQQLMKRSDLGGFIINHKDFGQFIYALSRRLHNEDDQKTKKELDQWSKKHLGIDLDRIKINNEPFDDIEPLLTENISPGVR